jgi:hypothetical protein
LPTMKKRVAATSVAAAAQLPGAKPPDPHCFGQPGEP